MRKGMLAVAICALLLLVITQTAWAAPPQSHQIVHIVRWGENLYRIARSYGTTVEAIAHVNHIRNPNRICAGQRLIIPCAWPGGPGHGHPGPGWHAPCCGHVYVVGCGDTLSGIAHRHGVSVNSLIQANGIANPNLIYKGQRLCIPCYGPHPHPGPHPAVCGKYYVVHPGDTLSAIAWRFGVSVWSIAHANGIANPNCIYAGQRLYIP